MCVSINWAAGLFNPDKWEIPSDRFIPGRALYQQAPNSQRYVKGWTISLRRHPFVGILLVQSATEAFLIGTCQLFTVHLNFS